MLKYFTHFKKSKVTCSIFGDNLKAFSSKEQNFLYMKNRKLLRISDLSGFLF